MSAFTVKNYQGISKMASARNVFENFKELNYEYDFGSTTNLKIKLLDKVMLPNDGNLTVLMRNELPAYTCAKCKSPATQFCFDCSYEDKPPLYCNKCIEKHGHKAPEYDPTAIINSPRMGVCGYDGPALIEAYLPSAKEVKPKAKSKKESLELFAEEEEEEYDMFSFMGGDDDDDMLFDPNAILDDPSVAPHLAQLVSELNGTANMSNLQLLFFLLNHYRETTERAMDQLRDEDFFHKPNQHFNSIAAIIKHLNIYTVSRFTAPFKGDGNKGRKGDAEFDTKGMTVADMATLWNEIWNLILPLMQNIGSKELMENVKIEGEDAPMIFRLITSFGHYTYHLGQIVQTAKMLAPEWDKVFDLNLKDSKEKKTGAKEISISGKKKK
jgi:hypothetical protein